MDPTIVQSEFQLVRFLHKNIGNPGAKTDNLEESENKVTEPVIIIPLPLAQERPLLYFSVL